MQEDMKFLIKFIVFFFVLFLSRVQCERLIKMQVADQHHCIVHVSEDLIKHFNESLEQGKKVIFFQINYDSKQAEDLTKSIPDDHFANPNKFMWLFDGENGLPIYMNAPYDFELHSLFILKEYTSTLTVNMNVSKSCNERIVSRVDFLRLVFRQLIKIVSVVKLPDNKASAYICYDINNRKNISESTFMGYKRLGSNRQILLRYCCLVKGCHKEYNNSVDLCKGQSISPSLVVNILNSAAAFLFAFSPMLIGFISKAKLNHYERPFTLIHSVSMNFERSERYLPPFEDESSWLNEKDPYCSFEKFVRWLLLFENKSTFASRIRRSMAVVACVLVLLVEALLQYHTMDEQLRSYLENNVPLGYRSMMFGYKASAENTDYFLGGPFVWFSAFLILWSIFINIPNRLCETVAYSILHQRKTWTFLLQDIELLYRFGGLNISNLQDYDLLHALLKSSLLTALNPLFWYTVIKRWFDRWKQVYNCFNNSHVFCQLIGIFAMLLCTFVTFFLCTLELLLCIVYYGFPLLRIIIATPYSYTQVYMLPLWRNGHWRRKILTVICFALFLQFYCFLFIFGLYIFSTIFLLVNNYIIYPLISLIAKPDATGFLLLILLFVYFLTSIAKSVSETYLSLQKLSITLAKNVCEDFVYIRLGEHFIYRKLFEKIVHVHHPIRYEVAKALVKLTMGAYILACCAYTLHSISLNMSSYIKIAILIFTTTIPNLMSVWKDKELESHWKALPILETIYVFQQETHFPNNRQMANSVQ